MATFSKDNFDYLDKKTKQILIATRESFVPHIPYEYEKNWLEAVRMGDLELAKKAMKLMDQGGKEGTLSENPLRQAQIIFISFITQITRAAMDASVAEDLAYAMSDSYIQASESCTSLNQIDTLKNRALRDFVNAVKHQKDSPPYCRAVRRAVNYIHSHMHQKISLQELSQTAQLSPGRFSHLFREETGLSPLSYVQKEKIQTAKTMLLYSGHRISEISTALGFSNESHFIKIFRQYTGKTPGQYRKSQIHSKADVP